MVKNNSSRPRLVHIAATPMTHLFLEEEEEKSKFYSVRRTRTAATVINIFHLSLKLQRVFNELVFLFVNPTLHHVFRNPNFETLKDHLVFIVDNGPSEAPARPLMKM